MCERRREVLNDFGWFNTIKNRNTTTDNLTFYHSNSAAPLKEQVGHQNGSKSVTDLILVREQLFELSVDLLNVIQVIHRHTAVVILLAHLRAAQLLR